MSSHWSKLKASAHLDRKRRQEPATAEGPAGQALSQEEKMAALDRLRQAIIDQLMREPLAVALWLEEVNRGALLGDAAASALELKGLLPDELGTPVPRRIRRNL